MIKELLDKTKIRVYLDLIVGLPYETYQKFQTSFDEVLRLRPHKLQMGFLKILKGSRIKKEADIYGYEYSSYPPYEVLANNFLSFPEISHLKRVEYLLDRYYNSGRFMQSLKFIEKNLFHSAFQFYHSLAVFWEQNELFNRSIGLEECYSQLHHYLAKKYPGFLEQFTDILKFDYLLGNPKGNLPSWCGKVYSKADRERHGELMNNPLIISHYFPHLDELSRKERINMTHSDSFKVNPVDSEFASKPVSIIFDYSKLNSPRHTFRIVPENF